MPRVRRAEVLGAMQLARLTLPDPLRCMRMFFYFVARTIMRMIEKWKTRLSVESDVLKFPRQE